MCRSHGFIWLQRVTDASTSSSSSNYGSHPFLRSHDSHLATPETRQGKPERRNSFSFDDVFDFAALDHSVSDMETDFEAESDDKSDDDDDTDSVYIGDAYDDNESFVIHNIEDSEIISNKWKKYNRDAQKFFGEDASFLTDSESVISSVY